MSTTTTLNPRVKREKARKMRSHRAELLGAEQAVRAGLDGFVAAGMRLRRSFEGYKRSEDHGQRFTEINKDLEVQVYSVEYWLTMVLGLLHTLATMVLTSFLIYGILDVEINNTTAGGVEHFLGTYWGTVISCLLALSILGSAAKFISLSAKTRSLLFTVAAYITVAVVPLYTMILCYLDVYDGETLATTPMFWASVANLVFGVLFVIGGRHHWMAMNTFVAICRRAWLRMMYRMAHRETEGHQDRTREKLSALTVVAGTMRHLIEELREMGGTARITMLGKLEAQFIDDHIYGEAVLLRAGTITVSANRNDPAEFLPLLERLGDERMWMDVEEEEPAPVTNEPEANAASASGTDTPPDADSAFNDDTTKGPHVDNQHTGRVHPEDRTI